MTERQDAHGAPTTSPAGALPGIDDFVTGLVGYHPRSANVLETAETHPDSALASIFAGFLWMFLERPEAPGSAEVWRQRAMACTGLNDRERGLLALLEAWQARDTRRALDIAVEVLAAHPNDLATLKLAQYLAFNLADAPAMLRLALGSAGAASHHAAYHSMLAFGREQCHQRTLAERAAQDALAIDANEPWAHHALSHVYLHDGRIDEGRAFLTASASSWEGLNSFMYTHNWWHLALFEIAAGDAQAALASHDAHVWGVQPDYSQDQINAVSLLARLECAGVDVGDRWQTLEPYLATRADDVVQPFVTLHWIHGLGRAASPAADTLMALIEAQASEPQVPGTAPLWRDVGIPAARGLLAHARGDHDTAVDTLEPVRSRLWMTGGSHAQRDLFEQILLDATLRAGRWMEAQPLLELRRHTEPDHPLVRSGLGLVHEKLGLDAPLPASVSDR